MFEEHPFLNKVIVRDKRLGSIRSILRTAGEIRQTQYDLVVNLHRFASSGWLTLLSKGKTKVGFKKNPLSAFYSKSFEHQIGAKGDVSFSHEVERNHSLIQEWCEGEAARPKLYPPEKIRNEEVSKLVEGSSDYLVMAPASVWFTKQFPKEKWVELLDRVKGSKVFLIGGPDDSELCQMIAEKSEHKDALNLCGKLSLLESCTLMQGATRVFVNDSAPLHLASSVNANVTSIFCSTIPEFGFGPLSDDHIIVQKRETLTCRPCGLHGKRSCPEGHFKCALDITTDDLVDSIQS